MSLSIIEQEYPNDFGGVLTRYRNQMNKSQNGIIKWNKVITSCNGYTEAIHLIGDLIRDILKHREIDELNELKDLITKVIMKRQGQLDRNYNSNIESGEKHDYTLDAWKNLFIKIKGATRIWIVVFILLLLALVFGFMGYRNIIGWYYCIPFIIMLCLILYSTSIRFFILKPSAYLQYYLTRKS